MCLTFRTSLVRGSTDGLLIGGGSSGRSWCVLCSGLVRFVCLRLILRAATESVSRSRGLNEGSGGSGGTGPLFDGTRCGCARWGWERVERLRRGMSYGSRGRGMYEAVGPGACERGE